MSFLKKEAVSASVLALGISFLVWAAGFFSFDRLVIGGRPSVVPAASLSGTISLRPDQLGRDPFWVLTLRIRRERPAPRSADVFVRDVRIGTVRLGDRGLEEVDLDVPRGLLRPGENGIRISGTDRGEKLERIGLKNHYGYSGGLTRFVLIPRASRDFRRLPWFILAGFFSLFLGLRLGRPVEKKVSWRMPAERAFLAISILVLGFAAGLPFLSNYRLLFSVRSVWLFAVFPNFSASFILLRSLVRAVKKWTDRSTLEADPRLRLMVSLGVPFLIFLFFVSFMIGFRKSYGGNDSRFLHLDKTRLRNFERLFFPASAPGSDFLKSLAPQGDYDGQFNYFMTFDPFLSRYRSDPLVYREFIDVPGYRYGRIGFPLLVKLASLDRPAAYPQTMIWLILISHFAGAFFLLRLILFYGKNPLWTFLYILVPGFYYALINGLAESISMALILAALFAHLKGRRSWTVVLVAASLFFRETGILLALAIMAVELVQSRRLGRVLFMGSAAVPYLLWRGFLTFRLFPVDGWTTLFSQPGDFARPFSGFVELYAHIASGDYPRAFVATALTYSVLLAAIFFSALALLLRRRDVVGWGLFFYALLAVSLNYAKVWCGAENALRLTYEAVVFMIAAFLCRMDSWKPPLRYAWIGLFAAFFVFDFFVSDLSGHLRAVVTLW